MGGLASTVGLAFGAAWLASPSESWSSPLLFGKSVGVSAIGGGSCCDGVREDAGKDDSTKAEVLGPLGVGAVPAVSSAKISASPTAAANKWAASVAISKAATALALKASTKAGASVAACDVGSGQTSEGDGEC